MNSTWSPLLEVNLERIMKSGHPRYLYKISPLNFAPGMPLAFEMKYTFRNPSGLFRVGLSLESEIDAYLGAYFSEDSITYHAYMSDSTRILIKPMRTMFVKGLGCMEKSRAEMIAELYLKETSN